jgi:oxaloacetate decarboxylase alpha subunit
MNLKELRELIEMVASEATIEEFEFERAGVRVHIRRGVAGVASTPSAVSAALEAMEVERLAGVASPQPEPPVSAVEDRSYEITSPMVGTFYRAPGPDADPFVKVGDFVEKGSVVCIIEAMKLMNEIESESSGEVVSIRVDNGHPVEYGDVLIVLRPR